jgi:MFS family permease
MLVAIALLIGTPFFVFFGWLSDKIGRKPIIMPAAPGGPDLFPAVQDPDRRRQSALAAAVASAPVTVVADPADCSFQFDPVGKTVFNRSCDLAKSYLAKAGVTYSNQAAPAGTVAQVKIGSATRIDSFTARPWTRPPSRPARRPGKELGAALKTAGYPAKADSALINKPLVVAILAILVIYVTMVYGPIAAMLVEMFPTNIRYTSMSLPYHIGNGWFGGFLPTTAFAMVAATGNIYYGLWYPSATPTASSSTRWSSSTPASAKWPSAPRAWRSNARTNSPTRS